MNIFDTLPDIPDTNFSMVINMILDTTKVDLPMITEIR